MCDVCCGVLWCVVVCCGVLWCVVVCCGVLWCVVVCCGVLWCCCGAAVVLLWCCCGAVVVLLWCCVLSCVVVCCRVLSCVVVVVDASLQTECFYQQTLRINWHNNKGTHLLTEEAEKCRTELRKMLPIITRVSHVKLEKHVQFSKCEPRKAKLQPEASTGQTSPFKPNGERTLEDPSPPQSRKSVKYVHSHTKYRRRTVSTVKPSIAEAQVSSSAATCRLKRHHCSHPV